MHEEVDCNLLFVWGLEGCQLIFCLGRGIRISFGGRSCGCSGLRHAGAGLVTALGDVASLTTEHAQLVVEAALALFLCELTIFAELRHEIGFGSRFPTGLLVLWCLAAESGRGFGGGFFSDLIGRGRFCLTNWSELWTPNGGHLCLG